MTNEAERRLWQRAGGKCEYCLLPQTATALPHAMDHIRARKHGGLTEDSNLCLACFYCNSYKGPNIAGVDPDSGAIIALFHPRRQVWSEHFTWHGARLSGLTPEGRATIDVLRINLPERISLRELLARTQAHNH